MIKYSEFKKIYEANNDNRTINRFARFLATALEIETTTQEKQISMQEFVSLYKLERVGYQKIADTLRSSDDPRAVGIRESIDDHHERLVRLLINNLESDSIDIIGRGCVFIIPNHAVIGHDFAIQKDKHEKLALENGSTMDDNFIQIWAYDPNNDNSNYQCHGMKRLMDNDGNDFHLPIHTLADGNIPAKVFAGVQEGDTLRYQETIAFNENDLIQGYQFSSTSSYAMPEVKFTIHWELKASQLSARYRNFGRFEEVVEHVTR